MSIIVRYVILFLSFLFTSNVEATVAVVRYPSGGSVQVCQANDANTDCGGSGGSGTVTSITASNGITVTPDPITTTGTISGVNAASDGATKGVAAFSSTNFSCTTGVCNTIQNISTGSAPSFAGLTLTGNLTLSSRDIVTDSTGTKFGTSSIGQKIGFLGSTPVAQQTGDVLTGLQNYGLLSGTAFYGKTVVTMSDATSFTPALVADEFVQTNTQATGTLTANAPSGTPFNGEKILIRIKSTNVQTFSWDAIYRSTETATLPTTTTGGGNYTYIGFVYNLIDTKWDCILTNNIIATTNANLTGPITSVGNATSVAAQTGTGSTFVMNTSPTLVTPVIGTATGTSLSVNSGATVHSANGYTANAGNTSGSAYSSTANTSWTTGAIFNGSTSGSSYTGTGLLRMTYSGTSSGDVALITSTNASSSGNALVVNQAGTGLAALITGVNEQVRVRYDASNYYSTTVGSAGAVTFDAVGASAGFTFSDPITNSGAVLTSPTITTGIVPTSNDGAALGSTSNQFSDLFLAEGGVINWDNGDATLTQAGNVVTLAGADLVADNITVNTALLPDANDGAALGNATTSFSDLFLAEGAVINFDNGDATITQTSNDITVAGISTFGVGTSTAVTLGTIELGAASDTTLSRVSAGLIAVEGLNVVDVSTTQTLTNKTLTSPILTTPSAFTTGGVITLAENTSIALDPAGSADGKYSGITVAGTAGTTLVFGDLVYLAAADSRWELADADSVTTSGDVMLGIVVLAAAADADPTTILLQGIIRADSVFPALTISAQVYASTTTGDIQVAQPSGTDDVIRVLGRALTADEIYFNPSEDYITHI